MKKNYVLDTNILLHDPYCLNKFEDNTVWIPHPVLEELDKFKMLSGELGYNAREVIRQLDEMRLEENLTEGVKIEGGGCIRLYITDWLDLTDLPIGWDNKKIDNIILLCVKAIEKDLIGNLIIEYSKNYKDNEETDKTDDKEKQEENNEDDIFQESYRIITDSELPGKDDVNVILVCNDILMRLKATMLEIEVQEYRNDRIKSEKIYTGRSIRHLTDEKFNIFAKEGRITVDQLYEEGLEEPILNEYMTLLSWTNSSFLAKYNGNYIEKLDDEKKTTYITARNTGQRFLQNSLMTSYEERPLTICCGPAGTGKTLVALACGLEQVMEHGLYKRVLLCRANIMMDEEIGFLPGTEREKIDPLLRGAYDNLERIFRQENETNDEYEDKIEEMFQRGYIDVQSI